MTPIRSISQVVVHTPIVQSVSPLTEAERIRAGAELAAKQPPGMRMNRALMGNYVRPASPIIDPASLTTYQEIRAAFGATCDMMEALVLAGHLAIGLETPGACKLCFMNARKRVTMGIREVRDQDGLKTVYGRLDFCGATCPVCVPWRPGNKKRIRRLVDTIHSITTPTTGKEIVPQPRGKGCERLFFVSITLPSSTGSPEQIHSTIVDNIKTFTAIKKSYTVIGHYGIIDSTAVDGPHCCVIFRIGLQVSETGAPVYRLSCSNPFFKRLGKYREAGLGSYKGEAGENVITKSITTSEVDTLVSEYMQTHGVEPIGSIESIYHTT